LAKYNYGEFEGLLPPEEDLYQKVLCLYKGVCLNSVYIAVDEW